MSGENATRSTSVGRAARVAVTASASVWGRVVDEWHYLRMWWAKGKITSKWWVPHVGDRVKLHGKGHWLVYAVLIRRGEVALSIGAQALECVEPLTPDELEEVYAYRTIRPAAQAPPVLPPGDAPKPVDLDDPNVFTVDGEVVDSPPETEG